MTALTVYVYGWFLGAGGEPMLPARDGDVLLLERADDVARVEALLLQLVGLSQIRIAYWRWPKMMTLETPARAISC